MSLEDHDETADSDVVDIFDGDPDAEDFDVLGAFIVLAESQDWKYDHFPDQGMVSLEVPTSMSPCQMVVKYEPLKHSLVLASVFAPGPLPPDMTRLYACLNEWSDGQGTDSVGALSYSIEHQMIRWSTKQCLVDIPGVTALWAHTLLEDCEKNVLAAQLHFASSAEPKGTAPSTVGTQLSVHTPVAGRA